MLKTNSEERTHHVLKGRKLSRLDGSQFQLIDKLQQSTECRLSSHLSTTVLPAL